MASAPARRHYSGLWLGSAVPAEAFAQEVAVNPIQWSASLLAPSPPEHSGAGSSTAAPLPTASTPSFFGAGFFDDAGDIPGSPVLFYTLRGIWNPETNAVDFEKRYDASKVSEDLVVQYSGKLSPSGVDGQPVISGTWVNKLEGVYGTFDAGLRNETEILIIIISY
eukprot:CAMPEP_0185554680 /NCGR_PEP_ID=MMETSP1381-20130426/42044_1 /TAXON_ID=298111 /ORGANISM="Pavlova sp., Strain CCMP459" /LENGTH=165 /DNA_ID=CAMNT_0028167915 /DNA_START=14 /DNA_END=512 /DNA_ORIENTATION=-